MVSKDTLWESGCDEIVEINQRALIDKVLARYSGEFTVFRELLQNSDDARSDAVEIRFETQLSKSRNANSIEAEILPDLKTTPVHQWTFRNNGHTFREEDWNRLKKIADGNPDEEKIGAFGVGFYSLFSVTEEPFVISGNQWMGFYWKDKKNQLFARRGQLPQPDVSPKPWTSFMIPLREPAPIPLAFDFARFLATSLTFMRHLKEVCVYFDDKRLVKLNKALGMPSSLGIPQGLKTCSPQGTMTVDDIQITPLVINAQVMKWIYASGSEKKRQVVQKSMKIPGPETIFSFLSSSASQPTIPPVTEKIDYLAIGETSVSLSIYSASIQIRLDKKMSSEIQRSTKKDPPAKMKFECIYTAKTEYDASLEEEAKQPEATGSILQGLRADIDGLGAARVFIGHSTAQSTGIGGHIAARFIPTVERESIDFMDRHVAVWNRELLYIGGILARAVYEFELSAMQKLWISNSNSSPVDPTEFERITKRALHTLKFFTFHPSTPSPDVSSLMETAFFQCSTDAKRLPIISNQGICDVADIRLFDPTFSFLKDLPILPEFIVTSAPIIINTLQNRGMIRNIDFADVFRVLQSRALAPDEFVSCLNWWSTIFQKGTREQVLPIRDQLINSVTLVYKNHTGIQKVIRLSSIQTFINPSTPCKHIPSDSPLPDHLLPIPISKLLEPQTLSNAFPWTEMTIVQWLSYICEQELPVEYNLNVSPRWAESVIGLIISLWANLPGGPKLEIIRLLRLRSCIPTSRGMSLPQGAYFPTVNIFSDLPVVTFTPGLVINDSVEKFLQDLGVRKHVELQLIFDRMIHTNKWTVADLINYLTSLRASLTPEELQQLRTAAAFPKEATDGNSDEVGERFMPNQLYEPLDVFRTLKLPVIDWGQKSKWTSSSKEAKYLFTLGLQQRPPLSKLIELCAGDDPDVRSVALKYLLDNMDTRYRDYDPSNFPDIKFIPALKGSEPCLGTIKEVFSPPWALLDFLILQPSYEPYAVRMKIHDHPPVSQLISILREKPPRTHEEAKSLFFLLSTRVQGFSRTDFDTLSTTAFVPTEPEAGPGGPTVQWKPPSQCYLVDAVAHGGCESFYAKLFSFVDFGAVANTFLKKCGTRRRPTVEDVAKILLDSPQKFYDLAGGHDNFLSELRRLAVNYTDISPCTLSKMKDSPILLGLQRKGKRQDKTADARDKWDIIHELKKPTEIIVVDDTDAHEVFGDSLFTAPQEGDIEAFYCHLGSVKFTDVVTEEYEKTEELCDSQTASDIHKLILERLPLFLHEQTRGRARISFSWLSENNNFIVKAFGKLTLVKQLTYGELKIQRTRYVSAATYHDRPGPVELWIAANSEIDMYEVAKSLNRLLFHSPKTNDTLVFTTILSTDLKSLARRGYNVDRILPQHKNPPLLACESRRVGKRKSKPGELGTVPPETHENGHTIPQELLILKEPAAPLPTNGLNQSSPTFFGKLKDRFKRKSVLNAPAASMPPMDAPKLIPRDPSRPTTNLPTPGSNRIKMENPGNQHLRPSEVTSGPRTMDAPDDAPGATPWINISKNIDVAVNSGRSGPVNLLIIRKDMKRVKESLNEGFCDISGRKANLRHIGQIGSMSVHLSEEIPIHQAETFMEQKCRSLSHFTDIIKPLATIYDLPLANIHIFYDLQHASDFVAFNRTGSIFLNLRYFEAWHESDVQNGKLQQAYISWYLTIAHEIAHNLIEPHNAEHEFYFSAICERYTMQLAHQLTAPTRGQPGGRK